MSQKVNALPDVNRDDRTPEVTGYIPAYDMGGDVSMSDRDRNTALPDANQDRVLPKVQISTGSPLMQPGRYETFQVWGTTGSIEQSQETTPIAVGPQYDNIKKSTQFLHDDTNDGPKSNSL